MTDDHERRLADIEKRLARLERDAEREPVRVSVTAPWCSTCQQPRSTPCGAEGCEVSRYQRRDVTWTQAAPGTEWRTLAVYPPNLNQVGHQFCACGRDVCRAPDCPSHKHDPLGR